MKKQRVTAKTYHLAQFLAEIAIKNGAKCVEIRKVKVGYEVRV